MSEADLIQADSLEQMLYGDALPPVWHAVMAGARGDEARFERFLARHEAEAPDPLWTAYSLYVALVADRPDVAERLVAIDTLPGRPAMGHAESHFYLAERAAGRGDWTKAKAQLAAARGFDPLSTRVVRAMFAALPFLEVPTADLEEIRTDVRGWEPLVEPPEGATELAVGALPALRLHLLGLVAAKLDHPEEALAWADSLDALGVSERLDQTARSLAATIRAQVAFDREEWARALAHLDSVRGAVPLELLALYTRLPGMRYLSPFAQDHARYLRGLALRRVGNDAEALDWLQNGFALTPGEIIYREAAGQLIAAIEAQRVGHP